MRLVTVLLGLVLLGCSTGGGPSLERTPASKYGRIVVAAMRMPDDVRYAVETRLSEEIGKRGVATIPLSSLTFGDEPRTPKVLVQKILQAGAEGVFVLDPFVFEEKGKPVVRSVILQGMQNLDVQEVVGVAPVTYKAALFNVDSIVRVWMDDVNSTEQKGKRYQTLATDAATDAVEKAIKAGVL